MGKCSKAIDAARRAVEHRHARETITYAVVVVQQCVVSLELVHELRNVVRPRVVARGAAPSGKSGETGTPGWVPEAAALTSTPRVLRDPLLQLANVGLALDAEFDGALAGLFNFDALDVERASIHSLTTLGVPVRDVTTDARDHLLDIRTLLDRDANAV